MNAQSTAGEALDLNKSRAEFEALDLDALQELAQAAHDNENVDPDIHYQFVVEFTPERALELIALARAGSAAPAGQQAVPVAWVRFRSDGGYEGPIMDFAIEEVRKKSGAWTPLYAAMSAAQAQPKDTSDTKEEA